MDKKEKAMENRTDCFVSGSLAVVLRVSRLFGLAPLRFIRKTTGWRVSISAGWSIYGHIFVTIMNLITVTTVIIEMQVDQANSVRMAIPSFRAVCILDSCLLMMIVSTAVYGAQGQMRPMISCFNQVQKMNCELNIHHWPMFSEKKKISLFILWLIVAVSFPCVHNFVLLFSSDMIDKRIRVLYWIHLCSSWVRQLRIILSSVITLHVSSTFKALNDCLMNLLLEGNRIPVISQRKTVQRLSMVYGSACDVVRDVDRCHGIVTLMILGFLLLHLVITAFFFINNVVPMKTVFVIQNMALHVINLSLPLFWCLFHLLNLILLVEPCHLTHVEMETTRQLVSKLMLDSNYEPLEVELWRFSKHLLLNKPTYSPLQVTTMSRSLVIKILASIITYLVILVEL